MGFFVPREYIFSSRHFTHTFTKGFSYIRDSGMQENIVYQIRTNVHAWKYQWEGFKVEEEKKYVEATLWVTKK